MVWGPHSVVCAPAGLTIPATATLTVLEDVIVVVGVGKSIDVQGALVVTASARQPATFTAVDGRPWGWVHLSGKGARAALVHAWFLQGGADSANSFGHSMPSQPVVMLQRGTSLTMTGGGFVENIGKAIGATDATLLLDTIIIGHCDTGGQLDDSQLTMRDSHVLEIPDGDGIDDDDDNDGMYLHGNNGQIHRGQAHVISNSVWAVVQDDGIDHNNANVELDGIWILSAHHECIATSGHNGGSVMLKRSVLAGCEQGIEAGYSSNGWPSIAVESSLITANVVGIRYGDDYQGWGHKITLDVKTTAAVLNDRMPWSPELVSTIAALGPEPAALRTHAFATKASPGGGFDYFHGFRDNPETVHDDKATIDACTRATMAQPDGAAGKQVLLDATTGACVLNTAPCPGGAVAGPPMCHHAAEEAAAAEPPLVGGDSFWAILDNGEVYIDDDGGGSAAAATTAPLQRSSCYGFGAWLHHLRSASLERIRKAKPATLYARPGTQGSWDGTRHCGVSFQADAVSRTMRSSIFAKVAVASPDWHDGEMHVREILSYFLDRLLGTFVVPPIAGRLVPLANVSRAAEPQSAQLIGAGTQCDRIDAAKLASAVAGTKRERRRRLAQSGAPFGTALIQWVPHVHNVPSFSRAHNWAHFVVFQYVAGCMRSGHNFFLATGAAAGAGGVAKQWWLSIDNDRCFTSNAVALAAETPPEKMLRVTRWSKEVFDDCAAVKAVPMVIWRLRHNADTIMEQFPLELEQDELAPLLLAFMRTAFAPPTAYVYPHFLSRSRNSSHALPPPLTRARRSPTHPHLRDYPRVPRATCRAPPQQLCDGGDGRCRNGAESGRPRIACGRQSSDALVRAGAAPEEAVGTCRNVRGALSPGARGESFCRWQER